MDISSLETTVRIGKNGFSQQALNEINLQLRKKKTVKVKFLRAFLEGRDKKESAKELAKIVNADLLQQVGFVVVLHKK